MMMNETIRNPSELTTAIIICCYTDRRWVHLRKAIVSALGQGRSASEVVVVVDYNPALAERLRSENFAGLVVTENVRQPGLSGARNTGIDVSRADVILFLDDDAVADPDLLSTFVRRLDADASVLGVGSTIRPYWENGRPSWFPEEFLWTLGCTYRGLRPGPVRNLIGASMCVRRSVFELVGGFNTDFGRTAQSLPLGCEETEFCIRAGKALPQGHFIFEDSTGCDHAIPASRATWRYFLKRCWAEGLSKASLSRIAGADNALASERTYVTKTLPFGVFEGLTEGLMRGRVDGFLKAIAIPTGLMATIAGFLYGNIRTRRPQSSQSPTGSSVPLAIE